MQAWLVVFIVLSLLFSAFFSGAELAFISSNKLFFELKNKQGIWYGKIISKFMNNPSQFIGTTLVGFTFSFTAFCLLMIGWLNPYLVDLIGVNNTWIIILLEILISALLIILLGDFLPRRMFASDPDRFLVFLAFPLQIIYIVFQPLVFLIIGVSKFIIQKVFHWRYIEDKPAFGLTDLDKIVKNRLQHTHSNENIEIDQEIFENALEFKTLKVRDCLVPRAEIEALDISDSIERLKDKFIQTGRSKILIYRDSIDEIMGYCHASSLFKNPKRISDIVIPITIIPESMSANDLMVQFIKQHKSIALVVDEFGGTSGIVTIEDIIEQIVGDIQDEHDEEEQVEDKVDEQTSVLSARLEIEYLNEKYGWNIPKGEYETLGGFIISITGEIPEVDDVVYFPPFKFTILSKEDARISSIKVFISH